MKMMKVNYHLAHAMNGVAGKTDKPNKRAMPILILLILVLSLIPLMPVMAISQPILFNEVWFDVPEAVAGIHYVWVKDMDAIDIAARSFNVLAKMTCSR